MSKAEDINFLKIQSCILKVNIHCEGCKQKVKKLLQKIDGVYTVTINAEQGKVTVSGDVDPAALLKKLTKAGKPAELLFPKPTSNSANVNGINQCQKVQLDNGKGRQQDHGKAQKHGPAVPLPAGGNDPKGLRLPRQAPLQAPSLPHPRPLKGFKDLNFPQLKDLKMPFVKHQKSVKFCPAEGDAGSDWEDEFEDDDDDGGGEDVDGFDDDFEYDTKFAKMTAMNGPPVGMVNGKNGGGGPFASNNGKKSGPPAVNGAKFGNDNGGGGGGDGRNSNQAGPVGGGGGKCNVGNVGGAQESKNGGKVTPNHAANGGGNITATGKQGGVPKTVAFAGGPPTNHPSMIPPPMMAQMANMNTPMGGQLGNMPAPAATSAVQGLPAGRPPPGYFQGGGATITPEMFAAANPYQQQYLAAMIRQQRMMMNGQQQAYPPMPYIPRPPPPVSYAPPPQPEYIHFFSDENTGSCAIM